MPGISPKQGRCRNRLGVAHLALVGVLATGTVAQAQAPHPAAPPAAGSAAQDPTSPSATRLRTMASRFAPVPIGADISSLPENEKKALAKMVEAARLMDPLFLRQVSSGNESLLMELVQDSSEQGRARLHFFLLNKGPWSRLDKNAAFIPGVGHKPEEANFYPAGSTKQEVEAWMKALPAAERAQAEGFFTTIRRTPEGKLTLVPYSLEYQGELARAAALLREAAALTTQPTLKIYLEKRAAAFISNDYYDSDLAWMDLDASIEPTIGPYEVYEDEWFNYKAAFEAFIAVRDKVESDKLAKFSGELQELENNLPIDPKYRNPKIGALAPIRVVNLVFSAGDANRGVQTAAYNLPNDERVVKEKGTKRVMLKNNQEAKFHQVLVPISKVALPAANRKDVSFDAFFTHILMHELMHGLGPHNITVDGAETTVRGQLKDTYSTIEEAKADISGLWALQQLVNKGSLSKDLERTIYTTFLASAFRSIRFGVTEAHGRGIAIQLNLLLDRGAFRVNPDGTFVVDTAKVKDEVTKLTTELMTLEAEGNYAKAKDLLTRYGVVRPQVQRVLDRLTAVPVDIAPIFVTADLLAGKAPPKPAVRK